MPPGYGTPGPVQGFDYGTVGTPGSRPGLERSFASGRQPLRGSPQGSWAAAYGDSEAGGESSVFSDKPRAPAGPSKLAQFAAVSKKPDFLVTWLAPLAVYVVNTVTFTYGFMQLPSVCIIFAGMLFAAGCAMLGLRGRGHIWFPLGVTLMVAVAASVLTGLYIYDQFACFPAFYHNSRLYSNVVPSEPSLAIADAGKITFTGEASVNTNRSAAFVSETGFVYCIAPIRDANPMPQVEFWAVGVQCCTIQGDFSCDAAQDASAHGGIRVFDNSGWFGSSRRDYYELARKKAEATHSLVSAAHPMYVRWVREDSLDMVANLYALRTVGNIFSFVITYAAGSALLAFALYRDRPKQ